MKTTRKKPAAAKEQNPYRAVWISDVHLGTQGCKAERLADFLKHTACDQLYLVGDIVDGWRMRTQFYWPQEHTNVIRRILTKSKRGTKVTYVAGNHDEFLRKFVGYKLEMGNIRLVNEATHITADGRRFLVIHGDQFDVITRYHKWLALAGDAVYETTMAVSQHLNRLRKRVGLPYWSLAAFAKKHVKTAVNIISDFESSVARECRRRGFDGAICGHIHHAEIREIDGVTYHNCGDWVESCTALAEDRQGQMHVLHWGVEGQGAQSNIVRFSRAAAA